MQGIQFLRDNNGLKTAALIDLKEHGKLWDAIIQEYGHPSGLQFLTDDQGNHIAVLLNFQEHGDLWEDIYDSLLAKSRLNDPRETLAEVKQLLLEKGKLNV